MRRTVPMFAALVMATLVPAMARADQTGASIGLSLAPLIGTHTESDVETHTPPFPIPIVQATGRYRNVEVFVESLPGSPAIDDGFNVRSQDTLSTHLAFFDAVARVYDRTNRYWVGAGEIIYNQSTDYTQPLYFGGSHVTTDSSRVAGGRYEFGAGLFKKPERVRLSIDLMPSLSGTISYTDSSRYVRLAPQGEHGAQFESNLAITNAHGPFSFAYGVRYVNYTTRLVRDGSLSDRNTGFLPYATFAYRFGRSR